MTARVSFADRAGRALYALGGIAVFAAVGLGLAWVLARVNPVAPQSPWRDAATAFGACAALGVSTWLFGVRVGGRTWTHWGWPGHESLLRPWASGVGLGLLMAALAVGLGFVASRATVRLTGEWSRYLDAAGPLVVFLALAALREELLFRGYPLRRLADALGPWAALGVFSLGFAASHLPNPNIGPIGIANIALAGVWLSFAFFSPGGMPLAWGLHVGWNAGLGLVFDAPVSGQRLMLPAVEYVPGKHAWIDGGAFGPAGGVVATVVLIAGTLAVIGKRVRQPKEWLV
ncbi:MAG: lysostaphin resistance A-like protein [Gemmatimonadales bacterium]